MVLEALGFEQKRDQKQPPEVFCKEGVFLKISPISQGKETSAQASFCEIGEIFKKLFWKTSANDCFWQMISGMAYPVLYNIKNIFKYLFP